MKVYHIIADDLQEISDLLKEINEITDTIDDIDNEGLAESIKERLDKIDDIIIGICQEE